MSETADLLEENAALKAMLIAKDGRYPMARIVNLGDAGQESWEQLRKAAGATAQFEILLLDELWQTVFQRLGIRAELERAVAAVREVLLAAV